MLSGVPVPAFFYRERLDPQRLRRALAVVLGDFAAHAGRFAQRDGGLYIEPSSSGVRFEEQESELDIAQLMAAARDHDDYKALAPQLSVKAMLRGHEPLMAVRITQARDGSVLAFAFTHAIGDLASAMLFLRAWSNAARDLAYEKPLDVPDRHAYLVEHLPDPAGVGANLRLFSAGDMLRVARYAATRKRRVDFHFGWHELERLREAASRDRAVTKNDAVCAHALSSLRQLDTTTPRAALSIMINYRSHAGLPANLLGNLVSMVRVTSRPGCEDLPALAAELRSKIENFGESTDYRATARLLEAHPGKWERLRCLPPAADPRAGELVIVSWSSGGLYDLVFESTTPALFMTLNSSVVPFFGSCCESPGRTGLTLSLYVPEALARRAQGERGQALLHAYAASNGASSNSDSFPSRTGALSDPTARG